MSDEKCFLTLTRKEWIYPSINLKGQLNEICCLSFRRCLLPANLLQHAKIEKEAVVAGVGNRAEIWSKEEWEKASTFDDINSIAAKMSEYGLSI